LAVDDDDLFFGATDDDVDTLDRLPAGTQCTCASCGWAGTVEQVLGAARQRASQDDGMCAACCGRGQLASEVCGICHGTGREPTRCRLCGLSPQAVAAARTTARKLREHFARCAAGASRDMGVAGAYQCAVDGMESILALLEEEA